MHVAFAAASRRVAHERGRIETRRRAAHVLFHVECGLHRGAQVFDALDQIVHVNVVRMHVEVAEPAHE